MDLSYHKFITFVFYCFLDLDFWWIWFLQLVIVEWARLRPTDADHLVKQIFTFFLQIHFSSTYFQTLQRRIRVNEYSQFQFQFQFALKSRQFGKKSSTQTNGWGQMQGAAEAFPLARVSRLCKQESEIKPNRKKTYCKTPQTQGSFHAAFYLGVVLNFQFSWRKFDFSFRYQ